VHREIAAGPLGRRYAIGLAVLLILLLSGTWLLSGLLVARADPFAVAAGRALTSTAGLSLMAASRANTRREARKMFTSRFRSVVLLGVLGVFGYSVTSVWAIRLIGAATTNLVLALLPCVTFGLGALLFRIRPRWSAVLGTVAAVAAAVAYGLLNTDGGLGAEAHVDKAGVITGLLLASAAVLCMALYAHFYGRLTAGRSPIATLPSVFAVGTAMLVVPALITGALLRLSLTQWAALLVLGGAVYVPAYAVQHYLLLARGPLFTTSVTLVVPFVVRISEWALGADGPPGILDLVLLAVCVLGVRATLIARPVHGPGVTPHPAGADSHDTGNPPPAHQRDLFT
jgi:drug/metabolite transporter (DMT)-like permease